MGYPLPMGYQCEGSGLEQVLRSLPVLVCEFMIFLDLVGTTGSHPSFTFIGSVPPRALWVAEASWKCIILSAHHQCPRETR